MSKKTTSICAIIPARFGSTRLPGKPILDFHGKTMIQWVYEAAAATYDQVAVATDHEMIFETVESFGGTAVMTSEGHLNGTSRVLEAYETLDWSANYVVNIQGDEPMLDQDCLANLNSMLVDGSAEIATLIARVDDEKELFGESEVFVVKDLKDYALYFSRAIIPFFQKIPQDQWLEHGQFLKHVGLYAFRPEVLKQLVELKPSLLETSEDLEQNRWLEHGFKIKTNITTCVSYPVDTIEDVDLVKDLMLKHNMIE